MWSGTDDGLFPCPALDGGWLKTGGDLNLRVRCVRGQVRVSNARIGGSVMCEGGKFKGFRDQDSILRPSIVMNDTEIDIDLCINHAKLVGGIQLIDTKVRGNLVSDGVDVSGGRADDDQPLDAVKGNRLSVGGTLFLRAGARLDGITDLTSASIGEIWDARECWPQKGYLLLNNCQYRAISGGPVDAASRLEWLGRQDPARWGADFWPQPYQQLAKVLREMGHEDEAKTVLVAKEHARRAAELRRVAWWRKPFHWLWTQLLRMVGYGYRPARALVPALGIVALGWGVVEWGDRAGILVPVAAGAPAARLVPLAYSFEAFVPIVKLGQVEAYRPATTPEGNCLQVYLWLHGLAGWLIGGIAAAGVLGLFRRE